MSPGALRTYSTIYSLGVEWDLTNDTDHDATAAVEYRISGTTAWRRALPLVRIDFNGSNMLAGSVLFLAPDTSYDLRLSLVDPDGGGETRVISQRTRPVPRAPVTGRIFHVDARSWRRHRFARGAVRRHRSGRERRAAGRHVPAARRRVRGPDSVHQGRRGHELHRVEGGWRR